MKRVTVLVCAVLALALAACSPKIYGTVQLIDANMQPIPATKDTPQGTVVNMINTTATLEQASHSVTVDAEGKFASLKDQVVPGMYKVEATRIGYGTETQSVEIKKFTRKKVEFKLKKILEGKRRSIEGSKSDEDKIVNPGEVNIQPPTM
jgi:hypothetical protein